MILDLILPAVAAIHNHFKYVPFEEALNKQRFRLLCQNLWVVQRQSSSVDTEGSTVCVIVDPLGSDQSFQRQERYFSSPNISVYPQDVGCLLSWLRKEKYKSFQMRLRNLATKEYFIINTRDTKRRLQNCPLVYRPRQNSSTIAAGPQRLSRMIF